ncbi:lipid-A-disaccharide synthase [Candidatus Margulisiibacteriota bacterium]
MPKLMISAAEVSGDVHGSYLVREIKKILPSASFFGLGGEKLKAAGVDVKLDITSKSSIGIFEAVRHIPSHLRTVNKLKKMMDEEKPDALILVDAQGFNMSLASYARSKGVRTIYYIAPQEWLWGTQKGVKKVVDTIDLIVSIFAKEHEIYTKAGGKSVYFGHPLIDIAKKTADKDAFASKYGIDISKKIIALCPGSRQQEIMGFSRILIETARKIKNTMPEVQFVLPLSSSAFSDKVDQIVKNSGLDIAVIKDDNYNALGNSDLVVAVSGTIVLETVILNAPVIMFYKVSIPTYLLAKYVLKVDLPYYSMPNILLNRMVVPEFLMKDANPDNLSIAALTLLKDDQKVREIKQGFKEVLSTLGSPGVIGKAARSVVDFLSN